MTPASQNQHTEFALKQDSLQEPLDSLNIELGRISAEIHSINSGFQAQMQEVMGEVRATIESRYKAKFEKNLGEAREQIRAEVTEELNRKFEAELKERLGPSVAVQSEMAKVSTQLENVALEITAMLDDTSIALSKVMRKRTEQAELKAYLDGLRFSTGA